MRLPSRAVGDDHVDRPKVYALQGVQPIGTNCPNELLKRAAPKRAAPLRPKNVRNPRDTGFAIGDGRNLTTHITHPRRLRWLGGGVPPLPIPNRAVKPASADGTATPSGRVGGRQIYRAPDLLIGAFL